MQCSVCGKDLGLWAKLSGQTSIGVCKGCQDQARSRVAVLVRSAAGAQNWSQQYARNWLDQFEEIVGKFHISVSEASPLRFQLINNILRLIESAGELPDPDLKFVVELARKYSLTQSSTPEVKDSIIRLGMREVIQKWERGEEIPHANCNGLVLQKNEVCHWEEGAGLRIQRAKRHYEGGFASVSVPIVKGVRVRVGGFKGYPVDETVFEDGGTGVMHVTNKRVCFAGRLHSVAIPYSKMINIQGFETGFTIQTSNEKKPGIFILRHPELTVQIVNLAASGRGQEEAAKPRPQKLPSTV